uniref:PHD-type domain-containing protein n=1 Tax=Anopheles albimanus TaxID=7167 RepID=A0A182FKR1_ANOAL
MDADDGNFQCAGFCKKAFHGKCLGLSPTIRKELHRNPQLLWVCHGCSDLMGDVASKMKSVVLSELSPMLDQMRCNILTEVDRRITHLIELSHSPIAEVQRQTVVSQAGVSSDDSYAAVTKDRLPNHRLDASAGSLQPPLAVGTAPKTILKTVPTQQSRLWLFFSRLATDTTDEQVADMVCYDVVVLTETWLNDSIPSSLIFGDKYTVIRTDRNGNNSSRADGGGVLIAVSSSFKTSI